MGQAAVNTLATAPRGFKEFKRGWKVVLSALVGIGLGLSPMPIYTIGIFAPFFMAEFGWSVSQIMGSLTITTIALLGAGPIAAWLASRFGVRPVVLTSLILFGVSFMGLGFSSGSLPLFYLHWTVITFVGAGTLPITWTKAVNHWFDERKGLALGMAMMGSGLFGIFCKPFLAWLIPLTDWRTAYIVLGLMPILIAFPIAFFFFRDTDTHPEAPAQALNPGGLTLRQATHDWRFWLLLLAFLPISIALSGPVPNMENILNRGGMDAVSVVMLTPLIGLSAMAGRMAGGWLLDRYWAPAVGFVLLSLPVISCMLLMQEDLGMMSAGTAIFMLGFALGIEYDLMAFCAARYFGMKSYTAIYSALYITFATGSGIGPLVFGWNFDVLGDYRLVLMASGVMLFAASASLLLMGPYRSFHEETPA